jgi:cation diffusion facilitator CzcD-associated flavoprotein CzcO
VARQRVPEEVTPSVGHVYDVAIVGAGFSGICAAIKLREAGIDNLVVLEKAHGVGGTWRENDYPGAACDVMAQLYSFSFAPNADWTSGYPGQAEILAYLNDVVDRYEVRPLIRFGTEVTDQVFDEARDEWRLDTPNGEAVRAQRRRRHRAIARPDDSGVLRCDSIRGQPVPFIAVGPRC